MGNPFASIDEAGVGRLMRTAIRGGRDKRSNLKLGICGEHAGDASSIAFCEELGLDYVSCSPPRVPVARLAAAQAVLRGISPIRDTCAAACDLIGIKVVVVEKNELRSVQ